MIYPVYFYYKINTNFLLGILLIFESFGLGDTFKCFVILLIQTYRTFSVPPELVNCHLRYYSLHSLYRTLLLSQNTLDIRKGYCSSNVAKALNFLKLSNIRTCCIIYELTPIMSFFFSFEHFILEVKRTPTILARDSS